MNLLMESETSQFERESVELSRMISFELLISDDLVWSERSASGKCEIHFHPNINPQLVAEAKGLADLAVNHCTIRTFITGTLVRFRHWFDYFVRKWASVITDAYHFRVSIDEVLLDLAISRGLHW